MIFERRPAHRYHHRSGYGIESPSSSSSLNPSSGRIGPCQYATSCRKTQSRSSTLIGWRSRSRAASMAAWSRSPGRRPPNPIQISLGRAGDRLKYASPKLSLPLMLNLHAGPNSPT